MREMEETGHKSPPKNTRFSSTNQPKRRRGPSLKSALTRALRQKCDDGRQVVDALATALITLAMNGNAEAIRQVTGRLDGPLPTRLEGDAAPTGGAVVRIVYDRSRGDDPDAGLDVRELQQPPLPRLTEGDNDGD